LEGRYACEVVDSFKLEFSSYLEMVEIREGRELCVLRIPPQGNSKGLIIFVHGACARMQQFVGQIRYFSKAGYEVLSYDALGCGNSNIPVGAELYTSQEMYRDLEAVVKRYTVGRNLIASAVIGHSMGGAMVTRLASLPGCRKYTRSVVSLCNPSFAGIRSVGIFKLPASILWLIRPLMGMKASELLFGPKASVDLRLQEQEASARNPVHMFKAFYTGIDASMFRTDSLSETLQVPTLFVGAELDKLCPCPEVYAVASHFKKYNTQFALVKGCGHQCMQEDADQVNRIVDEFLNSTFQ
jgi:pimeloyl-ACP methyl ester carboxylesterase